MFRIGMSITTKLSRGLVMNSHRTRSFSIRSLVFNPSLRFTKFTSKSTSNLATFYKRRPTSPLENFILSNFKNLKRRSVQSNYNRYYGRSNWDKLKRPALFTALFCIGTTFIVPPIVERTPLASNPMAAVYTLIAVNGAVFLLWRVPQASRLMARYGLLMKDNIHSSWPLLTAAFSHQNFAHLLVNMFVLHSFGTTLSYVAGTSNFLVMYLNSAVLASFVSLLIPVLTRSSLSVASLGASGAVFSVVGAFSYLFPKAPVALFFIPIPGGAWILFLGTFAYNIAGHFLRWGSYDYAAHIGGSIAGILYGWWFNQKRKEMIKRRRMNYF